MKKLIAFLGAIALLSPTAVEARANEEHRELVNAINSITRVQYNTVTCMTEDNIYGYYLRNDGTVVVWQVNGSKIGVEVAWTAEDYDTLRHEAQHMIQDCVDGTIGDMQSDLYIEDIQVSIAALGPEKTKKIIDAYSDMKPSDIMLEIEAFAVADNIPAADIAATLRSECRGK